MNKLLNIILISFFCFIVISCSSSSDSSSGTTSTASSSTEGYKRESIPSETTVSLPSTLTGTTSSSRTAYAPLSNSYGPNYIQLSVSMMKMILGLAEFYMTFFDAAISQSIMSTGNCYEAGTIDITFTAEMLQALKNVYSKIDSEMSASDESSFSAMVGTQINNPTAVSYVTTTNRGFEKKGGGDETPFKNFTLKMKFLAYFGRFGRQKSISEKI